jgi:hypothetical protein
MAKRLQPPRHAEVETEIYYLVLFDHIESTRQDAGARRVCNGNISGTCLRSTVN